jgi:hypothetical protein
MAVRAALPALAALRFRRRPGRPRWTGRSGWARPASLDWPTSPASLHTSRPHWTGWPHSRPNLAALVSTCQSLPGPPPSALADPDAVFALVAPQSDRRSGCARSAGCWCAGCGAVLPAARLCPPPVSCLPSGLPVVGAQRAIAPLPPCSCRNHAHLPFFAARPRTLATLRPAAFVRPSCSPVHVVPTQGRP